MSSSENTKMPWSKLTSGVSSLPAPGPPHMQENHCVNEKRKDNIPRKLEKKLREFGGSDSSGTSDSDAKDVGASNEWNPMKDDYSSPSFNSYTKGPGAALKPSGSSKNNFTLFIDNIPISLTRNGLFNLFSRCGNVKRASIIQNNNRTTTYGFIEYGTLKEADAALQQLNNFDMGKGTKLMVEVSEKNRKSEDGDRSHYTSNGNRSKNDCDMYKMNNTKMESTSNSLPTKVNSIESKLPVRSQKIESTSNYSLPTKSEDSDSSHLHVSYNTSNGNRSNNDRDAYKMKTEPTSNDYSLSSPTKANSTKSKLPMKSPKSDQQPLCNYCGQPSHKKCAVCRTSYCSQECQTQDWSTHKVVCRSLSKVSCIDSSSVDKSPLKFDVIDEKPLSQEETFQELNDLCHLMTHVDVQPSTLASSHTLPLPDGNSPSKQINNVPSKQMNESTPKPENVITTNNNTTGTVTVKSNVTNSLGYQMSMSYGDLNAAFGLVSPSTTLPVLDVGAKLVPTYFYAFVCCVVSSCRLGVFPLHKRSKIQILKFLEFGENMLDNVTPVTTLPDTKQLFGYKCGYNSFHRVELDSSTIFLNSYDTGVYLGSIDISKLFVLPPEFIIPTLKLRLSLMNCDPSPVKSTAITGKSFLMEKVLGKIVKVKDTHAIMEHVNAPFVIGTLVSIDERVNYNELLSVSGFAIKRVSNGNGKKSLAGIQHGLPVGSDSHSSKVTFHSPPIQTEFDIYPTVVTSPSLIWAQVFHEHSSSLEKLLENMNTINFYQGTSNSSFVPSVGVLCAARFSCDGLYYRAEVIRVNNNGLIDVQFVDYGNKETISFNDLHYLPPCFLSLPKQALCFALAGVRPLLSDTWSPEACTYIKDTILQQQITVKIISGRIDPKYFVVVNHPICTDTTVNDEMIDKGFAEKMVEMRGVGDKLMVSPKIGRGSAFNHPRKSPSLANAEVSPMLRRSIDSNYSNNIPVTLSNYQSNVRDSVPYSTSKSQDRESKNNNVAGMNNTVKLNSRPLEDTKQHIIPSVTDNHTTTSNNNRKRQHNQDIQSNANNRQYSQPLEPTQEHTKPNNIHNRQHDQSMEDIQSKPNHNSYSESLRPKSNMTEEQNALVQKRSVDRSISIPTITLPIKFKTHGIVVHVENPELFYIVSMDNTQDLVKLSETMQTFTHHPVDTNISIGDYCIAKYLQDNSYGRATVLKLKPTKALLQFVDYGNRQPVLIKDICVMDRKFSSLPQQAILCSLSGISNLSSKWPEQAIHYFTGIVLNKSLEVEIIKVNKNNVHEVKLVLDSTIDIAIALAEQGYTCSLPGQLTPPIPLCVDLRGCVLSKQCMVVLSDVTNLNEFYVHPYNNSDIRENIEKVIVPPSDFDCKPLISSLPDGALCFAKFKDDGQWYRGCVIGSSDSDYNVRFIDFGNCSSVSKAEISMCPDYICSLPVLAVKCSLYGISSSLANDTKTIQTFKSLATGKLLEATVVNEPSSVTDKTWTISLMDTTDSSNVDISSCLKSGTNPLLGISKDSLPPPVDCFPPVIIPSVIIPTTGDSIRLLVTEVTDPGHFYAELLTSVCLESFIQGVCVELPLAYDDPSKYRHFKATIGAYCCAKFSKDGCAKFSKDGCWYRCKVIELGEKSAKLFYVDYGNTDVIALDDLYHLDPKFASVPAQAVLCNIVGIRPVSGTKWSHTSTEYLKSIASGPLYAVVESIDDDNIVNVKLYSNEDCSESITSALIDNGLAVSDKFQMYTIPPFQFSNVSNDDTVNVVVSDVTSLSSLYIQIALPEVQRTLAGLQSTLSTYAKSSSLPSDYKPTVNDYCCAHFEGDGCWYRAQITSISGNMLTVCYIDFGNTSVVGMSEVRLLTQDLAKYPQVACHVSLSSLSSVPVALLSSFRALIDGKILNMRVVNRKCEPIEVELYDPNSENPSRSINNSMSQMATNVPVQGIDGPEESVLTIDPPCLPNKNEFDCMIVHIESLRSFCLQVTEDGNVHNLMKITENINSHSCNAVTLTTPFAIGQLCLAQFSGDFYRGKILEVSGEHSRVYFLDLGNTDIVHSSGVKVIPASLLTLPAQAIKCSLVGVSSDTVVNPEALKQFSSLGNVEVKCLIINRHPLIVDLQKNSASPTLSQSLGREGLIPIASKCPFYLKQVVIPSREVLVVVTEVEKPNIIWMQMFNKDALTEFEKVTVEMNKYCDSATLMREPLLLGQLCCAKFNADGTWYRGRVVDFAENGDSMIQFIDFGNIQQTPASLVREIPQSLLDLSSQGIPCLLNGDDTNNSSNLSGLLLNKRFHCIKKGVAGCGLPFVDLRDVDC